MQPKYLNVWVNTMTFKEWFELYHKAYCEDVISFDKAQDYKYIVNNCFYPLFEMELDSIKPIDIRLVLKNTLKYSSDRQRTAYFLLKRIFREAQVNEYCSGNPVTPITPPKRIRKEAKFFEPEMLEFLFDDDSKLCRMFKLDLWTGLRRGELLALNWENIDLNRKYIRVCQTIVHTKEGDKLQGTTKSRNDRLVPLHPIALDILEQIKKLDNSDGFLFCYEGTDKLITLRHFNRYYERFYRQQKEKHPELVYLSPHKLRHSYATYLIQSGADIETLRALLGHVDIMTTQRYVHSNLQQMQRAVAKLRFE